MTAIHHNALVLINHDHPVQDQEACKLVLVQSVQLEQQAALALQQLFAALHVTDEILLVSGYRSHAEQQAIYQDSLLANGLAFTKQYVAFPGHSEHQSGLAVDLGMAGEQWDSLRPSFPYGGLAQVFRELAPTFGWMERYPKGKEAITKIAHEPWHFRYVGIPHAQQIVTRNMVLEEYIEFLDNQRLHEKPTPMDSLGWRGNGRA